jgi:hypothetical protein
MYNAALDYGPDQTAGQVYSGDGLGPVYKNWEAEFLMMCICDWGTMGPECGTRMCPKGFDPLKTSAVFYREINVTTNATAVGAALNGTFVMTFDGFSFEFDANATLFDDAACELAWKSLDNVEQVTCRRGGVNAAWGATYNIQFLAWPAIPMQNNVFHHEGNPPLSSFTCDASNVMAWPDAAALCQVEDVVNSDIYEYQFCSGRGTCDFTTGSCSCYTNFEGVACGSSVTA